MSQGADPEQVPVRKVRDLDELRAEILYLAADAEAVSTVGAQLLRAVAQALEPQRAAPARAPENIGSSGPDRAG
jgi:hypothetical protein